MVDKLEKSFIKNSDRIAYKINDDTITYKELYEKVKYYADLLRRQDNKPVIVYGNKSIEMVISILACIFAKRTYIPIDVWTPVSRIEKIIEMSDASLLILNSDDKLDVSISINTLNDLEIYSKYNYKNFNTSDIIYIIFTSGSTGEPKGVPISNDNLNNFVDWISSFNPLNIYDGINVLNQASFSFDLSVADFYYSMVNGHTLVSLDKHSQESFNDMFNIIADNEINFMVVTPSFMKMCLLNKDFNVSNFPFLNCIYFCGEKLDKELAKKIKCLFPDVVIINAYGPTEATSAVTGVIIDNDMLNSDADLPIGDLKKSATEIVIENEEIILKGKSVFTGYLNNVSAECYSDNGTNCYKTGDTGYIDNNLLYFRGRKDSQIKYMGCRIELDDIEKNIKKIKMVKDCAVVAKLDDNGNVKIIKAFVVLDDELSSDNIKDELKKILPNYMIPKVIKIVNALPINQNGKIDRKLLKDL